MAEITVRLTEDDLELLARRVVDKLADNETVPRKKLLWSEPDVAETLSVSVHFLKKLRQDGYIESHTRRRPILYSWEQIEAIKDWLPTRT